MGEKQVVYTESMPKGLNKIITKTHIIIGVDNISKFELPLCIHKEPIDEDDCHDCSIKVCSNM
jgi:hypothetical protein